MAAVEAVVPAESAIAGKQLTLIEQANGCHESMAPVFYLFFADTKKLYTRVLEESATEIDRNVIAVMAA